MQDPSATSFLASELRFADVGTAEIAYRVFGAGPPLLMVHGWPLDGFTWRKLIPRLAGEWSCHVIDLPGAGDTRWRDDNDFSFRGQAANLARFVEKIGLARFHAVAHDTGATIARQLALTDGARIAKMVLIDTEIPHHRPPWIPFFQKTAALPGNGLVFRTLLRWRAFLRSSMGFGNVFCDPDLISGDFHARFIQPLIDSPRRMEGQLRYLRGIDWALVDSLAEGHRDIANPVLLIWGEDDPTFPVERARPMVEQFPHCVGLKAIPGARLLVHEERPEAVAEAILEFLRAPGTVAAPAVSKPG